MRRLGVPALALAAFLHLAAAGASASPQPMLEARANHAAVRLDDGRTLIIGGQTGYAVSVLASTEYFVPVGQRWLPGPAMRRARYDFAWVKLRDGRILVAGGRDGAQRDLREAELFDPRSGTWEETGAMTEGRKNFGLALLPDGRVLAAGGHQQGRTLGSAELYDPKSGRWSAANPMAQSRQGFLFEPLPDGRVLAAGGVTAPDRALDGAELYDPETGRWSQTGSLKARRYSGAAFRLPGGLIMLAGGAGSAGDPFPAFSEVYDPASGRWSKGPAHVPFFGAVGVRLDGRLAVIGGYHTAASARVDLLRDGRWETLLPMAQARTQPAAVELGGGRVLVTGGELGPRALRGVEILGVTERQWSGEPARASPAPTPPAVAAVPSPAPVAPHRRVVLLPTIMRRPERPQDFAIVVGIEGYRSLPTASYASGDADAVASAFTALGVPEENIVRLDGSRAALSGLSKYVEEWLPRRVTKGSRVWFYFSGHGAPDVEGGAPYLMPWDADAAFVRSTGFALSRLYAALEKLPAREVIVALDSCFSGTGDRSVLAPGLRPLVPVRMPGTTEGRVSVLAATEPGEAAGGLPAVGHGAFTYRLLEGLAGAADKDGDGRLTLSELHGYTRKRVILDARAQGREQTPTLRTRTPQLRLY